MRPWAHCIRCGAGRWRDLLCTEVSIHQVSSFCGWKGLLAAHEIISPYGGPLLFFQVFIRIVPYVTGLLNACQLCLFHKARNWLLRLEASVSAPLFCGALGWCVLPASDGIDSSFLFCWVLHMFVSMHVARRWPPLGLLRPPCWVAPGMLQDMGLSCSCCFHCWFCWACAMPA